MMVIDLPTQFRLNPDVSNPKNGDPVEISAYTQYVIDCIMIDWVGYVYSIGWIDSNVDRLMSTRCGSLCFRFEFSSILMHVRYCFVATGHPSLGLPKPNFSCAYCLSICRLQIYFFSFRPRPLQLLHVSGCLRLQQLVANLFLSQHRLFQNIINNPIASSVLVSLHQLAQIS